MMIKCAFVTCVHCCGRRVFYLVVILCYLLTSRAVCVCVCVYIHVVVRSNSYESVVFYEVRFSTFYFLATRSSQMNAEAASDVY